MSTKYARGFQAPDEVRKFKAHGQLELVKYADGTSVGRGVFEPGWKWSTDVGPIAGTPSCQASHVGYCISGSMTIKLDSGETFLIRGGESFHIPPGHDAWTEGKDSCVMIDFTGAGNYAKRG
jgi:hypothetical protein